MQNKRAGSRHSTEVAGEKGERSRKGRPAAMLANSTHTNTMGGGCIQRWLGQSIQGTTGVRGGEKNRPRVQKVWWGAVEGLHLQVWVGSG